MPTHNVFSLLQSAFTREEVEEARLRYADYLRRYPEDEKYDLAHGFSRTVAHLEDREREAARLNLSPPEIQEREALLRHRMPTYRDEREEAEAFRRLQTMSDNADAWLHRYPSDRHVLGFRSHLETEQETLYLFLNITLPTLIAV